MNTQKDSNNYNVNKLNRATPKQKNETILYLNIYIYIYIHMILICGVLKLVSLSFSTNPTDKI